MDIEESLHEKFKDTKLCTKFRKWRKCHNIFIFQLKIVSLNIWLYANLYNPPPLPQPQKNMICHKKWIRININIYVIFFLCICQMILCTKIYIKTRPLLRTLNFDLGYCVCSTTCLFILRMDWIRFQHIYYRKNESNNIPPPSFPFLSIFSGSRHVNYCPVPIFAKRCICSGENGVIGEA